MMETIATGIGLVGVGCILLAYFLLQQGSWASTSYRYLLLNLTGSIAITISLFWQWNTPSFVIEMAWIAISVYGLYKRARKV